MAPAEATVRAAARGLAADAAAAEVLTALGERGIPSLLLKGPAVARLLYAKDEVRSYGDVDLLVAPADEPAAGESLRGLGFRPLADDADLRGHRPLHATEWTRPDGVSVDLHRTVSGAGASPQQVWDELSSRAARVTIGRVEAQVPDAATVALLVGLHAAHHGPAVEKGLRELRRALERLTEETWREAAGIAERIEASPALAAGLSLDPAGAELARRLGLPAERPIEVLLRASAPPPLALGLEWLSRTGGLRARAGLVLRTAFPAPGAMRAWRARGRGRAGLALAYASHPLWLAWHLPPSLFALRRARREAR
jgi:hypothetical protein